MKMIKRLYCLIIAGLLFVTGCSSTTNFYTSVSDAMDIKSYKYKTEITIDLKAPSTAEDRDAALVMQKAESVGTLSLKIEGKIMESGALSAALAVSYQTKNKEQSKYATEGYLDITDIVYKDNVLFVNMKQLAQAANKIGFGLLFPEFTEDTPAYVKFESSELSSVTDDVSVVDIPDIAINNDTLVTTKEMGIKVYGRLLELLNKLTQRMGNGVLSDNSGAYELEIGRDSLESLCDALSGVVVEDLDVFIKDVITDLQEYGTDTNAQNLITQLTNLSTELNNGKKEEIVTKIEELKSNLNEITTFSIIGKSQIKGDRGSRYWELDLSFNGEVKHKIGNYTGLGFSVKHKEQEIAYTDVVILPIVFMTASEYAEFSYKVPEDEILTDEDSDYDGLYNPIDYSETVEIADDEDLYTPIDYSETIEIADGEGIGISDDNFESKFSE